MQPFVTLLAVSLLSVPAAFAGTLKVEREFNVVRSYDHENYQKKDWDKDQLTLTPGVKNFEIRTGKTYRADFCVYPFCGKKLGEYVPYMEMELYSGKKDSVVGLSKLLGRIQLSAKSEYANNSVVYRGRDNGQSFDIYEREAKSDRAANKRTEERECQEVDSCAGAYIRLTTLDSYGGCRYLYGKQRVTLQDRIYTKRTQMKFVGGDGKVLATYDETSNDAREEILSVGQCRLNRDRR